MSDTYLAIFVGGKTAFGIDTRVPGMVYAAVARSPVFGGKVVGANVEEVSRQPGVKHCFIVEGGSDLANLQTTATAIDGGFRISGRKWMIGNGSLADAVRTLG